MYTPSRLAEVIASTGVRKWTRAYDARIAAGMSIRSAAILTLRDYVASLPKKDTLSRALVDRAIHEDALRMTESITRDVPPPRGMGACVTHGWTVWSNGTDGRVNKATSEPTCHHVGGHVDGGWLPGGARSVSWSQNGIALFSTEALAYRALRHEVATNCARSLATIDARLAEIEQAERVEVATHPPVSA